jgi:ABC-2 type transport system ATP-binding protein
MQSIIQVEKLKKSYGDLQAVHDVGFEVQTGEIFGMVGPNGAGKTTTIEIIEGLRHADSGSIKVLGMDPTLSRKQLTERIGIQLQSASLPPRLRVVEALELFGALYSHRANSDVLLERMGLSEKRNTPISKLSGGQKQRLFIALALLNQPELVFFDELTTGLDPQARRSMWELVQQIHQDGSTVFLTTHFMEEAERLCDRVLILDHGTMVALDTPEALVASLGVEKRIVFTLAEGQKLPSLESGASVNRVEQIGQRVIIYGMGNRFASSVVSILEDASVDILDLRTEQPNLDDVFIKLTGREMRE